MYEGVITSSSMTFILSFLQPHHRDQHYCGGRVTNFKLAVNDQYQDIKLLYSPFALERSLKFQLRRKVVQVHIHTLFCVRVVGVLIRLSIAVNERDCGESGMVILATIKTIISLHKMSVEQSKLDVCTRKSNTFFWTVGWQHCTHSLVGGHGARFCALEPIQDGVRPCVL
jgi:hypothetical protein